MAGAQDQAFADLATSLGVLAEDAVGRVLPDAGLALPQALVEQDLLGADAAAEVLRRLARTPFACAGCGARFSYDSLARLSSLTCPGCGKEIERAPGPAPSGTGWPVTGGPGSTQRTTHAQPPSGIGHVPYGLSGTVREVKRDLLAPSLPPQAGRSIGPYTLVEKIGKGAYGAVYRARREGLERDFALKLLLDSEFADEETIARFKLEAAVASKIDDPGVISVVDVGREGDHFYYVMEHCRGQTLKETLKAQGKLPPENAARLVRRVAKTMIATHAKGVIHRDLKPSNIIVDAQTGRPRVTDFGLARDHSLLQSMTQSGDVMGTPHYMSPEQFRGELDIDHRIDLYALGVILYECLTGRRPYTATTPVELSDKVCAGNPADPLGVVPTLPPDLVAICLKAMSAEPEDRYPSAKALVADLERHLSGQAPVATREGKPWIPVAVGSLILGLIGGAGGLALRQKEPPPPRIDRVPQARTLLESVKGRLREAKPDYGELRADLERAHLFAGEDQQLRDRIAQTQDRVRGAALLQRAEELGRGGAPWADLEPLLAKASRSDASRVAQARARLAIQRGRSAEALEALESAPEDPVTGWLRALAYERGGKPAQAMRSYRALAQRDPEGLRGLTAAAALSRLTVELEDAQEQAGAALAKEPDDVDARLELAHALLGLGKHDRAEATLAFALALRPDSPRALTAVGELRLLEGKPISARAALERALRFLEVDFDPRATVLLGVAMARQRQQAEAEALFGSVLEGDPADVAALIHRGALRLQQGKQDAAREDWVLATQTNAMGALRVLERHYDAETREAYDTITREAPKKPDEKIFVLGRVREQVVRHYHASRLKSLPGPVRDDVLDALVRAARGEAWDDIEHPLKRAARLMGKEPAILLERARILVARDRHDEARKTLRRIPAGGPLTSERRFLEAELDWRSGSWARALDAFESLAAADSQGTLGLTAKAYAHWLLGNLPQAAAAARRALKTRVHHHPALAVLAMSELARRDSSAAMAPLREAYERVGSLDSRLLAVRAVLAVELSSGTSPLDPFGQLRDLMSVDEHLSISDGKTCEILAIQLALSSSHEHVVSWARGRLRTLRAELPDHGVVLLLRGYTAVQASNASAASKLWHEARKRSPGMPFPRRYLEGFEEAGGSAEDLSAFRKR